MPEKDMDDSSSLLNRKVCSQLFSYIVQLQLDVNILNVESLFNFIIGVDITENATNNTRPECSNNNSISGNSHSLHICS